MKVCVSSIGKDLESGVDPRFGRCQVFMFVDTDTMAFEAIAIPAAASGGGAGTQAAQIVADKGASAVLTGNIGPNAYSALEAAGIKIHVGVSGTVGGAVEVFKKGVLAAADKPTVERHKGMGGGI